MRLALLIGLAAMSLILPACGDGVAGGTSSAAEPASAGSGGTVGSAPDAVIPPPRYSDAELEFLAYDRAVAEGTNAALIMFLARNPESPYVDEARERLAERRQPDPPDAASRAAGPTDAEIVAAFDAARLSRDPRRLSAFIDRYEPHPLVSEARRLRDELQ